MKSDQQLYDEIYTTIKRDVPSFEVKEKQKSFFMKFLNVFVWLFNREFMTRFTTTIGNTVYFPEGKSVQSKWRTLAHEWWHMRRGKEMGQLWHGFVYMLPQSLVLLALLSILAFWFSWALWFLVALVFLLPIPAYFRYLEEFDAYLISLATTYWRYGHIPDEYVESVAKNFYGPNYYFMWPFKSSIISRLRSSSQMIMAGAYDSKPLFAELKSLISSEG